MAMRGLRGYISMDRHYNGQRGKQRKQKAKHRQNTTQKYKDRTTQNLKTNKRQRKAKKQTPPTKKMQNRKKKK